MPSYYESAMYGDEVNTMPEPPTPKEPKYPERFYVDYETWKHELKLNPNTIGMQSGNTDLEMKIISGQMQTRHIAKKIPETRWTKRNYNNNNSFFDKRKKDSDDYTYWIKACGLPLTTEVILDNWET